MPTFYAFIAKAKKQELEERIFSQWITLLPGMSKKEFEYKSFEDYKAQCTGENIDNRTAADIVAELEELHGHKLL